jgi:hypothetical protein
MEFYDGMANKWFAEWISTNQLPKMVRVALSFGPMNAGRRPENMTIRSIPLSGYAITRGGAGVMGGSGNGLAPNLRNTLRPVAPSAGPSEDDLWTAYLPKNFRSGGNFGNKSRNQLFPPD